MDQFVIHSNIMHVDCKYYSSVITCIAICPMMCCCNILFWEKSYSIDIKDTTIV